MSATIAEAFRSRTQQSGANPSAELVYVVANTTDDNEAQLLLEATAPATFTVGTVVANRKSCRLDPTGSNTVWMGYATYGVDNAVAPQEPDDDPRETWDFSGESARITHYLTTPTSYAPAGEVAPDFDGAINVTDSGVEGVDIVTPFLRFELGAVIDDDDWSVAYKADIYSLIGTTNDAPFHDFAAGEVLFLGATISKRNSSEWDATFRFEARPNRTSLEVGASIDSIEKGGHQYLWVRYEKDVDATADALVEIPKAVYVGDVYESGDFSLLGV